MLRREPKPQNLYTLLILVFSRTSFLTAGDAVGPVFMQHQVYIHCFFFSYFSQLGEQC